jgi:hypothetical protein
MKFLFIVLFVAGCSFGNQSNEKSDGHHHLYSAPEKDEAGKLKTTERRLIIISTNDLKGQLEAQQEDTQDKHSPERTLISVGGAEIIELATRKRTSVAAKDAKLLLAGVAINSRRKRSPTAELGDVSPSPMRAPDMAVDMAVDL